jgi:hypothetical protein
MNFYNLWKIVKVVIAIGACSDELLQSMEDCQSGDLLVLQSLADCKT